MSTSAAHPTTRVVGQWNKDGSWHPTLTVGHVWADGVWRPAYVQPEPFFWHPLMGWFA